MIAVIPARGGSKGVPRKNIRPFAGSTLLDRAIDCALSELPPERVIVTTDDPEILARAKARGLVNSVLRPPHLASDSAPMQPVLMHAAQCARDCGINFTSILLLQPTSPLRSRADMEAILQKRHLVDAGNADMAVSVCRSDDSPYYNLFETTPQGLLTVCKGHGLYTCRQDTPPVWKLNGAFYLINADALAERPMGAMSRIPVEMPPERSIDVDTPDDFARAERLVTNPA